MVIRYIQVRSNLPTLRKGASCCQHVTSEHDPLTPWHLHVTFMFLITAWKHSCSIFIKKGPSQYEISGRVNFYFNGRPRDKHLWHAFGFIRDTSIRDMVRFPRQTKEHMVEETICLELAKGQFGFKAPNFCRVLFWYCVNSINMTLKTHSGWSKGDVIPFLIVNGPVLHLPTIWLWQAIGNT